MTGGGKKKNVSKARKPVMSNGKSKPKVRGGGLYTLPAALTKVLKSSVVSAVKNSIPKGTFEKRGAQFGRGLANIVGFGDYVVNDIVSMNNNYKNMRGRHGTEAQLISNCEYVGDVLANGSSTFTNTAKLLEPTDTTFPWLSQVAKLYTKYRFRQLLFEFRSMSSEYSSQIGLGTIIMAPIYNKDQPDFTNKQQMEAAAHAVSFKPSNSAFCGVECARKDNNFTWYNVRLGDMDRTPLTDFARLNVAISGIPASVGVGTILGELWVHYTCELIEPIISTNIAADTTGYYGAIKITDTAAGLLADSAFGVAKSAAGNRSLYTDTSGAVSRNIRQITMTTGKPTNKYWVAFDDLNYSISGVSQQDRVWFAEPGTYKLRWRVDWSTQPTGIVNDSVWAWTPTVQVGNAIFAQTLWGLNTVGSDRMAMAGMIDITVFTADTAISFRPNASMTGLTSAVLGTGMVLDITHLPVV
jgi:hypothetical protein